MLEYGYMAPTMFAGLVVFLLFGFPVAFSLSRARPLLRDAGDRGGLLRAGVPAGPALPDVRHHVERPPARHPLLHLHGRDPGAKRPGRGFARGHRPALRPGPGRPRLRRDRRRRHPRRHHRHGGGLGDRHGHDLAADHAQVRLRHAHRHRRDRRLGHHHPGDPAVPGADRARRPDRRLGGRHVPRRGRPLDPADRALPALHPRRLDPAAAQGAAAAARGAHAARLAAHLQGALGDGAVAGADLPRARHHLHGARHPDRGRRHGRGRRDRARHGARALQQQDDVAGDELDHADHRHGRLHPDRRDRLQPGVSGGERRALDRAHPLATCRAGWSGS